MRLPSGEITSEVLLCDRLGNLNPEAVGWSRKPLHRCNLQGRWPRKKKWDYWCVMDDRFVFSATIAHIDYLSLGGIYFLEHASGRSAEKGGIKPFSRQPAMGETVGESVVFRQPGLRISFEQTDAGLAMTARANRVSGKPFQAVIEISRPDDQESLNVVIPWSEKKFQFTSKQECLPAAGRLAWGEEEFTFRPGETFACLDFGRGVWPYRTTWNWASFSGRNGEDIVGINLGAKWTDGTGMNENGILLNGRLHKIPGEVRFEYDPKAFMSPWRMSTTSDDMVNLTFTPFHERTEKANLALICTEVHQLFGYFSGTLRVEDRIIPVNDLPGWAEEHRARW